MVLVAPRLELDSSELHSDLELSTRLLMWYDRAVHDTLQMASVKPETELGFQRCQSHSSADRRLQQVLSFFVGDGSELHHHGDMDPSGANEALLEASAATLVKEEDVSRFGDLVEIIQADGFRLIPVSISVATEAAMLQA